REVGVAQRGPTALWARGNCSADPPDSSSGSDGLGNLGHLVDHLEQVSKLIGGGIGTDLDRIVDAGGPPGRGVEPPAALTRAPVSSIPSAAASRYRSLRTQPAAARWSRCPPVKSASTVTPPGVRRCGKRVAAPEPAIIVPAPTVIWKRLSISGSLSRMWRSAG